MTVRSLILGCAGPELSADEVAFFRDVRPWGFILFRRNVVAPDQVRRLTSALRSITGRCDTPILIDQEGGRVQRMGPPHWPAYPPGGRFASLAGHGPQDRAATARLGARLMADDLARVGINVDCAPVLDVPVAGAHDVIGDRAYGADADAVVLYGRAVAEGLLAGGVLPVMKHVPGHGRAGADSHLALPVVTASREALEAQDFRPFRALSDLPLAMTAHVVFTALDPDAPATTSRAVLSGIVRGTIGFDGCLMSDDLSMQALSGDLRSRAEAALAAGCDLALHCNGRMDEMRAVAEAAPVLAGQAARRAQAALARLPGRVEEFDRVEARARFEAALTLAA